MIREDIIQNVVASQRDELQKRETGIPRELAETMGVKSTHATIISGIRRCGKSTLLKQIIKKGKQQCYYINFEDPRLLNFEVSDFEKLKKCWEKQYESDYYFFDEIQNVPGWERFVRWLVDQKKRCFITGSNASLLSKELGTRLTGRHITYELLPFSYQEWLQFTKKEPNHRTFEQYQNQGGFPEFLEENRIEILQELFTDVLTRDIIVRHKIRDVEALKKLALFLISNVGKALSFGKLAEYCMIKSPMSVLSYVSYLEDSYIIFTLQKFSYSYKKQIMNPKKIYCIDTGLIKANAISFSPDTGRIFENNVYLHLRRKYKEIYYFKERGECDFIVVDKNKPVQAIQVCHTLTNDNEEREIAGLKEAMKTLKIQEGMIITSNQKDIIDGIKLVPAWKWMSGVGEKTVI